MTDELVDKFNLKGILGEHKLQGYKIIEIIQGKFLLIQWPQKLKKNCVDELVFEHYIG